MIQFIRILQAGLRNFTRNAWLSAAATAVMTITLTLIIFSYIANSALTSTVKSVTDKIDVSLYLADSTTADQLQGIKEKLNQTGNVDSFIYVSKADALAKFQRDNKGNSKLSQAISETDNPLPASLQIKAKDPKKINVLADVAKQSDVLALLDKTAPVSYNEKNKKTIDRIVSISNFIGTAGLIGSLVFIIISTLIIFNTIRMAIFTRRDEIEIMKLVGATKWFIRGPFIFEAALYGILAAVIALALSYSLLLGGAPKLAAYIDVNSTIAFFRHYPLLIVSVEIVIGVFIGMISSVMAMSRYLKL
jgi:cell division transport system permease protein